MKKILALALSLTMAVGLLAGCSDNASTSKTEDDGKKETTSLSGTVNTDGSTSMEKVVKYLSESFQEKNDGVTINYSGTGSGTGIEAVIAGTCDIGLSSRELKDEEVEKGAVAHVVALDGVAIVVNPKNGVEDLTVEEIAKLATGEIKDWSELGGEAGPVAFIGREAGSGTRGAFEEIVGVEDKCVYTNELTSTGDVITNVASNPNAIGYVSLSAVNDTVKALKVEGVACTEKTVKDGSYEIQRPFIMVTKDGTTLSEAAQAFLDYATGSDVADLIQEAGAVSPN